MRSETATKVAVLLLIKIKDQQLRPWSHCIY